MPSTAPAPRTTETDRAARHARSAAAPRLVAAVAALIATDAAGGLLSIGAGVSTWSTAWGSTALLAAPLPMMAGQILLAWLSVRTDRGWAAIPAGLLGAACAVSIASGFFDGGLRNQALSPALFGFQLFLLTVTGVVSVLACLRATEIVRLSRRRSSGRNRAVANDAR